MAAIDRPMPKIFALVPAAGQGTRLGEALPKQYLALAGQPMLFHALSLLATQARIHKVLAILAPGDTEWTRQGGAALGAKVHALYSGGAHRGESVLNALAALQGEAGDDDWVLVHDAARPCVSVQAIDRFIAAAAADPVGGLLAMPVADTLKQSGDDGHVQRTVPREGLWRAQTPQMFRYGMLRRALAAMPHATDEAQAIEALGHAPLLVPGENLNIKVTFPEDLPLAALILGHQARTGAATGS